jgi:hypothetical protein
MRSTTIRLLFRPDIRVQFSQNVGCEELVDLSVRVYRLSNARLRIAIPVVISTVPNKLVTRFFQAFGSNPFASSDRQFTNLPDAWNLATRQIPIQITKIILKFRQRLALSQVVGE